MAAFPTAGSVIPDAIVILICVSLTLGHITLVVPTSSIYTQTVSEYLEIEKQYVNRPPLNLSSVDDLSPVCYDAMWTFAYALNNTIAGITFLLFITCLHAYIYMYIIIYNM